MRGMTAVVVVFALAAVAGGCGSRETSGIDALRPSAPPGLSSSPAPSPSPTASPAAPVDVVPVLTNPPGYPACGFYTWVQDFYGQKVTQMNAAVAVQPTGAPGELGLTYQVGTINPSGTSFRNGELSSGRSWTPPGTSSRYLVVSAGPIPGVGSEYLTKTTTIVVIADPLNKVAETNETNNVLTLRVRPTKRSNITITDNRCTVAR